MEDDDVVAYTEFDNDENYDMDCIERVRDINLCRR